MRLLGYHVPVKGILTGCFAVIAISAAQAHVRVKPAESKLAASESYQVTVPTEGKIPPCGWNSSCRAASNWCPSPMPKIRMKFAKAMPGPLSSLGAEKFCRDLRSNMSLSLAIREPGHKFPGLRINTSPMVRLLIGPMFPAASGPLL